MKGSDAYEGSVTGEKKQNHGKGNFKMEIYEIIALCMLGLTIILFIISLITDKKNRVYSWLLGAVATAEKQIGSGKGQQKLQSVYDRFVQRYPVFSVFISFDTFSRWVDIALDTIRTTLDELIGEETGYGED